MLSGQMMHRPLRIISLIEHAAEIHGQEEIVSAKVEGGIHRETYREAFQRIAQLAHALRKMGIQPGDRVATMAWNGYRHYELYYAVSGMGAVCHTINPRLFHEQLEYIINHAQDRVLFLDLNFVPLLEALRDKLPKDLRYVLLTDEAHMVQNSTLDPACYETLLVGEDTRFDWPEFDENTASSLCYTSGTTGEAKGVLYSHRSTLLHAFISAVSVPSICTIGRRILPVVPLFHANAWSLPYTMTLTGGRIIFPGPWLDGKSLFDLMEAERVESAWGVPTVWLSLMAEIKARGRKPAHFSEILVGGSAAPRNLIQEMEMDWDVRVIHGWGMTEMSPIGSVTMIDQRMRDLPDEERLGLISAQGRRVFSVDLKIVDDDGNVLPHDGKHVGLLYTRGSTIAAGYYNNREASAAAIDDQGWFATGDVARITDDGFLYLVDRSKDLIKSGGEWISSIDLENVASAHDDIHECAVIARADEKWGERPLLIAVPAENCQPSQESIMVHLSNSFAKWQLPDEIVFVDKLPHTATGKVSKLTLRQQYC